MLRLGLGSSSAIQRNRAPHRVSNVRSALITRSAPLQINAQASLRSVSCQAAPSVYNQEAVSNYVAAPNGKLISSTEVPAFIQRDDMMDQLFRWTNIEAGESGFRNFGMPMTVEPTYRTIGEEQIIWGFKVGMLKDGVKLTDIGVQFDALQVDKHEWVGRDENGFPVNEGRIDIIQGRNIEIWKMDTNPVTEDLRSVIRGFCTGLVATINRYYAFGSVFVDDERG